MFIVDFVRSFLRAWAICLASMWYSCRLVFRDEIKNWRADTLIIGVVLLPFLVIGCLVWFIILTFGYACNASFALHHISGRSEFLRAVKHGDYDKGLYD